MFKFLFLMYCFFRIKLYNGKIFVGKCLHSFEVNAGLHPIAEKYGFEIKRITRIDEVSWVDILTRRIKVLSIPSKDLVTNSQEKWKRRFIRWLGLEAREEIYVYWIYDLFTVDHGSSVLFVEGAHIAEMYSLHLPHFAVNAISNHDISGRVRLLFDFFISIKWLMVDAEPGVSVFANTAICWIIERYRFLHPNRKIILRFHDLLECLGGEKVSRESILSRVESMKEREVIDEVESYFHEDAKDLNGVYRPNGVNPDFINRFIASYRERLYCFIGASNKRSDNVVTSRKDVLRHIACEIAKIYPNAQKQCEIQISEFKRNRWISYREFVRIYSLSEVYIDLVRVNEKEGFSFRVVEALWLNRKIISNRLCLRQEVFYSPDRIFLIGYDSMERLRSFLEADLMPLSEDILRYYDSRFWWTAKDPYAAV